MTHTHTHTVLFHNQVYVTRTKLCISKIIFTENCLQINKRLYTESHTERTRHITFYFTAVAAIFFDMNHIVLRILYTFDFSCNNSSMRHKMACSHFFSLVCYLSWLILFSFLCFVLFSFHFFLLFFQSKNLLLFYFQHFLIRSECFSGFPPIFFVL